MILVRDLDRSVRDYETLKFAVTQGGEQKRSSNLTSRSISRLTDALVLLAEAPFRNARCPDGADPRGDADERYDEGEDDRERLDRGASLFTPPRFSMS